MRLALITPAIGTRNVGDSLIEEAIRRLVPAESYERFDMRRALTATEMARLNHCDAALVCGSNPYQTRWGCHFLTREFLQQLRVPLIPLGMGCSAAVDEWPQLSPDHCELLRQMHEHCQLASVRDEGTQRWLSSHGIANARVTGCPVLFHALKRPEFQSIHRDGPVALSLRRDFLHGSESLECRQGPLLDDLCRQLRPTLVCQGPADDAQAKALARRHRLEVFNHWQDGATESYEWLARNQAWSLNLRLHFGMLALSYGKPSWWIGQDSRTAEFCRLMGLPFVHIRDWQPEWLANLGPGHEDQFSQVPQRWEQLAESMREVLLANGLPCALDLPPEPPKPRILFMVPCRQWAYDFSAKSLAQRLAQDFDIRIRYSTDRPALRPEAYDLAQVFYWGEDAHLRRGFAPNQLILGCSSHRWQHPGKHGPLSVEDFAQRHLRQADTVLCTSLRLRDQISGSHPNVHHAPNGIETSLFFDQARRQGNLRIGAAGSLTDEVKGYADILQPAAEGYDFELAPGNMAHAAMNDFYNRFDVIAIASAHEGEPLTLMEAMAAGCFPVATPVGIVPELVRHRENGYIVEQRSPQAFREAFQWCQDHLEDLRAAGRANAEKIRQLRDWDSLVPIHRQFLTSALNQAQTPRFVVESALDEGHRNHQRLRRLIQSYGQQVQPMGNHEAPMLDLARDIVRAKSCGQPWTMTCGRIYRIGLLEDGPHGISWGELAGALQSALRPRPSPSTSLLARATRALVRRFTPSI
jgi:hypothetical protein